MTTVLHTDNHILRWSSLIPLFALNFHKCTQWTCSEMRILRFRERNPTRASSLPMRTGSLGNGQIFAHYTFCLIALFVASTFLTGFPSSGLSVLCFALLTWRGYSIYHTRHLGFTAEHTLWWRISLSQPVFVVACTTWTPFGCSLQKL